jgi:hypothetical protein
MTAQFVVFHRKAARLHVENGKNMFSKNNTKHNL